MADRYFFCDVEIELTSDDTMCFRLHDGEGEYTELYFPSRCAWHMAAKLMSTAAGDEFRARRIAKRLMEEES